MGSHEYGAPLLYLLIFVALFERELTIHVFSLFIEFLIKLWVTVFRFDGETSRIEERKKPTIPAHTHDDPHEDGIYLIKILFIIINFQNTQNKKRELSTEVSFLKINALLQRLLGLCNLGHDYSVAKFILSRDEWSMYTNYLFKVQIKCVLV